MFRRMFARACLGSAEPAFVRYPCSYPLSSSFDRLTAAMMSIGEEEDVQHSCWAGLGKQGRNTLPRDSAWNQESKQDDDASVRSRSPFRSSSGGGFHGTVPRLAPKGKVPTSGGKSKTLKEFLKALGHEKYLSALNKQDIETVDDLQGVIEGRSEAVALQELRACGLSVKAASDVYQALKKKDATVIELAKDQDYHRAWSALQSLVGTAKTDMVPEYCSPKRIPGTCHEEELKKMVRNVVEEIDPTLTDSRAPLVCGIRNGTGYGKTHMLLNASKWLDYQHSVYITYNLGQSLNTDRSYPKPSTIGRVLIGVAGGESVPAEAHEKLLPKLGELTDDAFEPLKWLLAAHLARAKIKKLFIGVDEIAMLADDEAAKSVTSALGEIIAEGAKRKKCVRSIMTSLSANTLKTISNRDLQLMNKLYPLPAADVITYCLKDAGFSEDADIERKRKMIQACCGNHPRSVVHAVKMLGEPGSRKEVTFADVWSSQKGSVLSKVTPSIKTALRGFVTSTLCGSAATKDDDDLTQPYRAEDDSIPPIFLAAAFEKKNDFLSEMFKNSASLNVAPEKQVEITCKLFDKFRAYERIPIFHQGHETEAIPTKWLNTVKFPLIMKKLIKDCDDDIFKKVKKEDTVKLVKENFESDQYYHPKNKSHPWIDRAFLVTGADEVEYLVLCQDKINHDLPRASDSLAKAVKALTKEATFPINRIICVAHCAGRGVKKPGIPEQLDDLGCSVVVLTKEAQDVYFTRHFAPLIQLCLDRHN